MPERPVHDARTPVVRPAARDVQNPPETRPAAISAKRPRARGEIWPHNPVASNCAGQGAGTPAPKTYFRSAVTHFATLLLLLAGTAGVQSGGDEQYQFLVGLYDKGLYTQVVKEAQNFLNQYPGHPKTDLARYRLACAFYELNQKPEAAPQFRTLTEKTGFEYLPECWFRLGQCEFEAGRDDAALAAFGKTLEGGKEYLKTPARFFSAEALFRKGDFERAETFYGQVLQADNRGEYAKGSQYGLVWCAYRLKHYTVAMQRIASYVQNYPRDAAVGEMHFLRGEMLLEADQAQEALAAYRQVSDGPYADAALRGAGFALAALQDERGAAAQFGALVAKFPQSRFAAEAALQQGIHLLKADQFEDALAALSAPAAGEGPELLYWRAQAQQKSGRAQDALAGLDRALAQNPPEELAGRIHTARGDVLYELGRLDEAAAAYGKSGSDYALHAAAVASLNASRFDEAAAQARQFLDKFPQSQYTAQIQVILGEANLQLKKYAEAEPAFGAAMSAGEESVRARATSRLAWCRFLQNDFAGAAERFAEVLQRYPKAADAEESQFMLGRAQLAQAERAAQPEQAEQSRRAAAASWSGYLQKYPRGEWAAEAMLRLARLESGAAANGRLLALVQTQPDSALVPQALLLLAENLSQEKKYGEAEPRYRELLQRFPEHELAPSAQYGLAWLLNDTERSADAAALLKGMLDNRRIGEGLRVRALELLVFAEHKNGNPDGALAAYQRLAGATNDEAERLRAAQTVVVALKAANRADQADTVLDSVARSSQNPSVRARALVERSYLALEGQRLDPAEAYAREAQRAAPAEPAVLEGLFFVGEARFEAEQFAAAAALYHEAAAAEASPVRDRAYYKEGFAQLRLGEFTAAQAPFQALVQQFPKSELYGESLFLLGECRYRAGQYEAALEPLQRLRQELPRHQTMAKCLFRLGLSLGQLQRWPDCQAALTDLARNFPQFENAGEAELWRGRALAEQRDARGARQAFEKVIALDGKSVMAARARLELGRLLFQEQKYEEAMGEFLRVAVLFANPEEVSEGLFHAGLCLEQLGQTEQARVQYQEILQKYPNTPFARRAEERLRELQQ